MIATLIVATLFIAAMVLNFLEWNYKQQAQAIEDRKNIEYLIARYNNEK